jgi:hypothetical protein
VCKPDNEQYYFVPSLHIQIWICAPPSRWLYSKHNGTRMQVGETLTPSRPAPMSKLAIVTLTLPCLGTRVCSCRTKEKKSSCTTLNLGSSSRDAYCPRLKISRHQDQPPTFPAAPRCVILDSTSRTHDNGSAARKSHNFVDTSAHLLQHVLFVRRLKMDVI